MTLTTTMLAGCSWLWLDTYWRSERYVLTAVDTLGQMHLVFDLGDGAAIGLVGPTVFSIGADTQYIVVKRHPGNAFGEFDRKVIEYFVLRRVQSEDFGARQRGVQGPFALAEFEKLTNQLHLLPFTKTISELE